MIRKHPKLDKEHYNTNEVIKLLENGKCPWEHCGGKLYCELANSSLKDGFYIKCHNGHVIPVIQVEKNKYIIDTFYFSQFNQNDQGKKKWSCKINLDITEGKIK